MKIKKKQSIEKKNKNQTKKTIKTTRRQVKKKVEKKGELQWKVIQEIGKNTNQSTTKRRGQDMKQHKVVTAKDIIVFDERAYSSLGVCNEIYSRDSELSELNLHYTDKRALKALLTDLFKVVTYAGTPWDSNVLEIHCDLDIITRVTRITNSKDRNHLLCEVYPRGKCSKDDVISQPTVNELKSHYDWTRQQFQLSLDKGYISQSRFNEILFELDTNFENVLQINENLEPENSIIIAPTEDNYGALSLSFSKTLIDSIADTATVILNADKLYKPIAHSGDYYLHKDGCYCVCEPFESPEGREISFLIVEDLVFDEYKDIEFKAIIK